MHNIGVLDHEECLLSARAWRRRETPRPRRVHRRWRIMYSLWQRDAADGGKQSALKALSRARNCQVSYRISHGAFGDRSGSSSG